MKNAPALSFIVTDQPDSEWRFLCSVATLEFPSPSYEFCSPTFSIEVDNPILFNDRITKNAPALSFMVKGL